MLYRVDLFSVCFIYINEEKNEGWVWWKYEKKLKIVRNIWGRFWIFFLFRMKKFRII